jgi:hypothetical protein
MDPQKQNGATTGNGTAKLLTVLAQSGNQWVQLATVGLVALSGVGNWVATWNSSDRNKQEIEISRRVAWEGEQRIREEVRHQIEDIHKWIQDSIDEFHKGNADSAQNKRLLGEFKEELAGFEARQLAVLNNQNSIMANQTQLLNDLHNFVKECQKQLEHR